MRQIVAVLFLLLGTLFAKPASGDPTAPPATCSRGDFTVGPNCVHTELAPYYWANKYAGMAIYSTVYRLTPENAKLILWDGKGRIVSATLAQLVVELTLFPKEGGVYKNSVILQWNQSRYGG